MTVGEGSPSLVARWGALGADGRLVLEAADLWMLEVPLLEPVATATGEHRRRPLVMVRLTAMSDRGPIAGWGECAALDGTRYDPEDADHAFDTLAEKLLPELAGRAPGVRRLPGLADLSALRAAAPDGPMAFAALAMAVADAHLRADGRALVELLGVTGRTVDIGAVLGLAPSDEELGARAASLVTAGYSRLKIKIGPGRDAGPLEAVSRAVSRAATRSGPVRPPPVRLQADANGSYGDRDVDRLVELDRFGLLCLEQPLDPTRPDVLAAHARLAARVRTPICLDESVRGTDDLARALDAGACATVCLKPARLGGLGDALTVVERCVAEGTPLWMGGMFESGYARGVNTALAALPGFSWPGDLSPARSYLATDLVPPSAVFRRPESGALAVPVPSGAGMGRPPDQSVVTRLAVRHVRITPA